MYSGVLQGVLYRELTEALRRRETCHGDLIWMYNDCWPETGWTIIDYYTTRKISFYFQKRAFSPVHTIVRVFDKKGIITALNDSAKDVKQNIKYGIMNFSGEILWEKSNIITVPAFSRMEATTFEADIDTTNEFAYCMVECDNGYSYCSTSVRGEYRQYNLIKPDAEIVDIKKVDGAIEVLVESKNYIPVVYLDVDDRIKLSDNFFEMIPNIKKKIIVYDDKINIEDIKLLFLNSELSSQVQHS